MQRSFVLACTVMFDQSFVRSSKQNKQTNRNAIRHMSTAVVVDLRSDTVTRPSALMRARMSTADVGDDVYQEDPTVSLLECTIACMFGKESALFFPTGTMGNLAAVLAWCDRRGCEVVAGGRRLLPGTERSRKGTMSRSCCCRGWPSGEARRDSSCKPDAATGSSASTAIWAAASLDHPGISWLRWQPLPPLLRRRDTRTTEAMHSMFFVQTW
jgi:hypothetical protein